MIIVIHNIIISITIIIISISISIIIISHYYTTGYLATPLAIAGGAPAQDGGQAHAWTAPHDARAPGWPGAKGLQGQAGAQEMTVGYVTVVDTYTLKPVGLALAHRSHLRALCLNPTGQLLATASTKGTVVRLFAVPSLDMLYSFRRGASACRIHSLLFSRDSAHVCAAAASGTVHIFKNSERVLGSLPLQSEEATVGAARREMISRAAPPGSAEPGPAPETPPPPLPPAHAAAEGTPEPARRGPVKLGPRGADDSEDDLPDDWNLVMERPERLLELCMDVPSYGGGLRNPRGALQTISQVSELAAESTAKYAKTLLRLLPQPCRELVDAPRAFAWVHLPQEEVEPTQGGAEHLAPQLPLAEGLRLAVLGGLEVHGGYGACVACVSSKPRGGRAELLVATVRGCAHIYEWSPAAGGECRLRTEHSFMGPWLQPGGRAGAA